jgi:rhodanese-related sulfurtransferase
MWNTPEDCTAVVQVMEEYERLARPTIIGRLNFDETPSPKFSSSFKAQPTNNKSSKTDYSFARRSSKDRDKDVALLCAKGRISQLENESQLVMTERKRARIEQDKESEIRQGK